MTASLFTELWYHTRGIQINSESFGWQKAMLTELDKRRVSIQFLSNAEWEETATPQDEPVKTLKWRSNVYLLKSASLYSSLACHSPPKSLHTEEHLSYDTLLGWGKYWKTWNRDVKYHILTPFWICSKRKHFTLMLWGLNKTTKYSTFCNKYNLRTGMWTYTALK